jgi:hypothetical protein
MDATNVIPDSAVQMDALPNTAQQTPQGPQTSEISDADVELDSEKYETPGQMGKTVLEGGLRGLVGPLGPAAEIKSGLTTEEAYKERMKANPGLSTGSEIATFGGSLLAGTGEAGLISKAGEAIEGLTEAGKAAHAASETAKALGLTGGEATKMVDFMTQDVPTLSKVGSSALRNAIETAAIEGSNEVTKEVLHDPESSSETALSNVGLAAALGGGAGAFATGVISPLWRATLGAKLEGALSNIAADTKAGLESGVPDMTMRPIVKKALSALGGVSEQDIDAYLANVKSIRNAPEYEQVYEHSLDTVGKIYDDVSEGKSSVAQAKSALRDHEQDLMNSFRQTGADAAESARLAKQALKDAQVKMAYDTEQTAMNAGRFVAQGVESLRQRVVNGSAEAYNILDSSGKSIPLTGFFEKGEDLANKLESYGTLEAKSQAQRIREYLMGVQSKFPELTTQGPEAKALIQGLDQVSQYDFNASMFDKGLSRTYKQLRYDLDSTLKKTVPEYAAAMKPVAKETSLLNELSRYGDEDSAVKAIRSLRNPANYKNEMPLLRELEKTTGVPFTHELEPYVNEKTKAIIEKSLPEYAEAQKTAESLRALRDPSTKAKLVESINASEHARLLREAEAKLSEAEAKKASLKGVTPQNLQQRLKTVATPGKNLALEEALKGIPELQGKTIPEIMNLLRINEAFTKNATRGSKHVNLYAAMMGSLANLLDLGGITGMGVGALTGAAVDKSGPEFVKKLLDKYVEHFGNLSELTQEGSKGAAKEMLGKILGADIKPNADGFKAGTQLIENNMRGHVAIQKAAAGVFDNSIAIIKTPESKIVADREKLDKSLDKFGTEGSKSIAQNVGNTRYYMPEHHNAMVATVNRQVEYLKSLKPMPYKPGPLDKEIPPTKAQLTRYHDALDIANNPNTVLQKIKTGDIKPIDIQDLKTMYPAVYNKMSGMLMKEVATAGSSDAQVPYKTRLGVSLFIGQPLDATMQPTSIQAVQAVYAPKQPPQQPQGKPKKGSPSKMNEKGATAYRTPNQTAEADRSARD